MCWKKIKEFFTGKKKKEEPIKATAQDPGVAYQKGNAEAKQSFDKLEMSLDEFNALARDLMKKPEGSAALLLIAFKNYLVDVDKGHTMLQTLLGPTDLSNLQKQFIKEHLKGQGYKIDSYFDGAIPGNNYTPKTPYVAKVFQIQKDQENFYRVLLISSGADSARPVTVRKKPSTGLWYVTSYEGLLAGMRKPAAEDKWA